MILSIRTDKPEPEIGLYSKSGEQLNYLSWQAHKELSTTIHKKINKLLSSENITFEELKGIVFYKGPRSFTGLRIGASVAQAFASGLDISLVGVSGTSWIDKGIELIGSGKNETTINIEYGSIPRTTKPRK